MANFSLSRLILQKLLHIKAWKLVIFILKMFDKFSELDIFISKILFLCVPGPLEPDTGSLAVLHYKLLLNCSLLNQSSFLKPFFSLIYSHVSTIQSRPWVVYDAVGRSSGSLNFLFAMHMSHPLFSHLISE